MKLCRFFVGKPDRWWQLKCFLEFSPLITWGNDPEIWGFMIQFDDHIFQMGWFNHQLETP